MPDPVECLTEVTEDCSHLFATVDCLAKRVVSVKLLVGVGIAFDKI